MYHVITDLELMFGSLAEAEAWAESRPMFYPKIPATAMCGEDMSVPRICGALDIRGCVTAIGVTGRFRRCLNSNPDAKSYENDDEAYPVLIAKFKDDGWTVPDKSQVPDIADTGERWLLRPARPEKIYLRWLGAYSIGTREGKSRTKCVSLKFLDDVSGYSHPWLDGKGHPLDCPDMGGDPWPDAAALAGQVYMDKRLGGNVGFAVPNWPLDGSWTFTPFGHGEKPYRTYPDSLRRFTGRWDEEGEPVFEGYVLKCGPDAASRKMYEVRYDDHGGWSLGPWGLGEPAPFPADPDGSGILRGMSVYIGHAFNHEITVPDAFRPARKTAPEPGP